MAGSKTTWNGGAIPANTKLIFDSAAATYAVTGPVTLGDDFVLRAPYVDEAPALARNAQAESEERLLFTRAA
jgi:hypothetical protein